MCSGLQRGGLVCCASWEGLGVGLCVFRGGCAIEECVGMGAKATKRVNGEGQEEDAIIQE